LRRQFHMSDADAIGQRRRELFVRFSEEIAAAPPTCRTLILSDEHCHSRLVSSEEVQNLKDLLDHFCRSYRIVLYLRPQHELAISQYGMFVANGIYDIDMLPRFPPPVGSRTRAYTNRDYFDYKALLERWAGVFGSDALRPRIYGVNELRDGDIVADFASELSMTSGQLIAPPRRNGDLSARAQALLGSFYRCLDIKQRAGAALLRERVRNAARACFPGSGGTTSKAEVTKFLEQFGQENESVRARWFPERQQLFEIDLDKYPEEAPRILLSQEDVMTMILEILLMDQELGFSLTPEALNRLDQGLPPHST
jgi:hypothetical protein